MRRTLTWIAFLFFTAVTVAVVAEVVRTERAAPPPFNRDDLQAWLTAEPSESPDAIAEQRLAARQLARDFHAGYDWQPVYEQLPVEQREPFEKNFRRLLLMLVEQRSDAYAALPPQRREDFLDAELNDFAKWYVISPQGRSGGLSLFQAGWLPLGESQLQKEASPKAKQFVSILQRHLVGRSLSRILPFGNEPKKRED